MFAFVEGVAIYEHPLQSLDKNFIDYAMPSAGIEPGLFWLDDGIYYARLPLRGETQPLTIALHGISDQTQASEAYQALLSLS